VSGNGSNAITVIGEVKEQHRIIAVKAKTVLAQAAWLLDRRETCSGQRALHATLRSFVTVVAIHIDVENHVLYPRALAEREE
jgi:iron-sulfur cluster repair protein YtfE (RIC family)